MAVDLFRGPEGRLEGEVRAADGAGGRFDGVLELLRILEGFDLAPPPAGAGPDRGARP